MKQLRLFEPIPDGQILVPPEVEQVLSQGAALAISISGGKDSQALLNGLVTEKHRLGWPGPVFAIHAHLGRAEWQQTLPHCQKIARDAGVELIVVRRSQGDLVDRWQQRMETLRGTGKPFWSSAANRYCTSDLKRGPINKHLRKFKLVVSAEGIRADESRNRAKQPVLSVRGGITTSRLLGLKPSEAISQWQEQGRLALTWNAIHHWSLEAVWEACGTSLDDLERRRRLYRQGDLINALDGWPAHPAYVLGNQRLSCALCVLASRNDLINGARHNPQLYQELVEMEAQSGFTFRQDLSLAELQA